MASRKTLVDFFRSGQYKPLTTREIARKFAFAEETAEKLLHELQKSGEIILAENGRWRTPADSNMLAGRLDAHPNGFGFVKPASGGEDIFVPEKKLSGAMDGDLVIVKPEKKSGQKNRGPSGRVIKILERAHNKLVGTFYPGKDRTPAVVTPDEPSLESGITVQRTGLAGKAGPGDKVLVEITGWPDPGKGRKTARGRVIKIYDSGNIPEIDEQSVIHQFDLPENFPEEAVKASEKLPFDPPEEFMQNRRDLSALPAIAVDPEDARDCDDALSLRRDSRTGDCSVFVHIADVSRYVTPGGVLDREARNRGTSVYLLRSFIPMIPREATQLKLSLMPGRERMAKTVEMRFDRTGKMKAFSLYSSKIKLDAGLTYREAEKILNKEKSDKPGFIIKLVKELDNLAQKLRERRRRAGSVDLDVPEHEISLGKDGRVNAVSLIERDRSHGLVEEFMLAANAAVAAFLREKKIPAVYRVHEPPEEEDMKAFADFAATLIGRRIDPSDRGAIQQLLSEVKGTAVAEAVNMELLRCMKRAEYSADCFSHFALNFPLYCHFTSPIRRYPDLLIHQILDCYFDGGLSGGFPGRGMLDSIAHHCSCAEARAQEAEREIVKIKLLRFLEEKCGEKNKSFKGIITGVKEFGFFAQLEEFSVEGMVGIHNLKDDFYLYHPDKRALVGRKKGGIFQLGQPVLLKIAGIDMAKRRLDFIPGGKA